MTVALLAYVGLSVGCGGPDQRPPVWSYISPVILQPNCATSSCHSPAAAVAGLDFSDLDTGYASLTRLYVLVIDPTGQGGPGCGLADGVVVCERKERPLVVPYDPSQSRLVNMLRARNAPRMPPDRPLPEEDIRLIERWILNGAGKGDGPAIDASAADAATDAGAADTDAPVSPDGPDAGADGGADAIQDAVVAETGG
jgi:hypothetical protein